MIKKRLSAETETKLSSLPREAYRYWLSIAPDDGRLPGRQHINPIEIPQVLPNLLLIDVERDPRCYRFRLVGTAVVEAMHAEFTGLTLEDMLDGATLQEVRGGLDRIVETQEPDWRIGSPVVNPDKRWKLTERLCLPLAGDGETVDMLLCVNAYHRPSERSHFPAESEPLAAYGR